MSFDQDPADDKPSYQCPTCSEEVTSENGVWWCLQCDWWAAESEE